MKECEAAMHVLLGKKEVHACLMCNRQWDIKGLKSLKERLNVYSKWQWAAAKLCKVEQAFSSALNEE